MILPEGNYIVRVTHAENAPQSSSIELRLVVDEGGHKGASAGRDRIVYGIRGVYRARRILAALGVPNAEHLVATDRSKVHAAQLIGRRATVTVVHVRGPVSPGAQGDEPDLYIPYDGWSRAPSAADSTPTGGAVQ